MTLTRSETQWIARVMHTISYVAFVESCSTLAGTVQKGAGDEVVRAAQSFIEKLKRENAEASSAGALPHPANH